MESGPVTRSTEPSAAWASALATSPLAPPAAAAAGARGLGRPLLLDRVLRLFARDGALLLAVQVLLQRVDHLTAEVDGDTAQPPAVGVAREALEEVVEEALDIRRLENSKRDAHELGHAEALLRAERARAAEPVHLAEKVGERAYCALAVRSSAVPARHTPGAGREARLHASARLHRRDAAQ